MKKILLLFLICFCSWKYSPAQCDYYMIFAHGDTIGCASTDSLFFDYPTTIQYVLNFDVDEVVKNFDEDVEATYSRTTGVFKDNSDYDIMTLHANGDVTDYSDYLIAHIDNENGVIYDSENSVIYTYNPGMDIYFVAYFFLHYLQY